uniref:Uncharacterized protein n=1 Tax=Rhizophora mucronata TaxID=61149 RepID=A0A2P2JY68_RHIMU
MIFGFLISITSPTSPQTLPFEMADGTLFHFMP